MTRLWPLAIFLLALTAITVLLPLAEGLKCVVCGDSGSGIKTKKDADDLEPCLDYAAGNSKYEEDCDELDGKGENGWACRAVHEFKGTSGCVPYSKDQQGCVIDRGLARCLCRSVDFCNSNYSMAYQISKGDKKKDDSKGKGNAAVVSIRLFLGVLVVVTFG